MSSEPSVSEQNPVIRTLMLVDDEEIDNEYHTMVVESTGLVENITTALNGQQALDKIEAAIGTDQLPELILLDINMPVMDGFEFLESFAELKEREHLSTVVIVMLTTSLLERDVERTRELSNLGGFLSKPLTAGVFRDIVTQHCKNR